MKTMRVDAVVVGDWVKPSADDPWRQVTQVNDISDNWLTFGYAPIENERTGDAFEVYNLISVERDDTEPAAGMTVAQAKAFAKKWLDQNKGVGSPLVLAMIKDLKATVDPDSTECLPGWVAS